LNVIWQAGQFLGRVELDLDDAEFVRLLSRLHVWSIDLQTCRAIQLLDFRGDPADEIIAATSLLNHVPLATRYADIRKSRVVPLARTS